LIAINDDSLAPIYNVRRMKPFFESIGFTNVKIYENNLDLESIFDLIKDLMA
jgi:hypothetical protein